jgi:serine/threonine protein kinase
MKGAYPPLPPGYSRDLADVVRACIDLSPERRPTAAQLLGHPALASRTHLLPAQLAAAPPGTAQSALLDTIKVGGLWAVGSRPVEGVWLGVDLQAAD